MTLVTLVDELEKGLEGQGVQEVWVGHGAVFHIYCSPHPGRRTRARVRVGAVYLAEAVEALGDHEITPLVETENHFPKAQVAL